MISGKLTCCLVKTTNISWTKGFSLLGGAELLLFNSYFYNIKPRLMEIMPGKLLRLIVLLDLKKINKDEFAQGLRWVTSIHYWGCAWRAFCRQSMSLLWPCIIFTIHLYDQLVWPLGTRLTGIKYLQAGEIVCHQQKIQWYQWFP